MSEAIEKTEKVSTKKETRKYTKDSILASEKYRSRKDILQVLLEDGKSYDLDTVDKMVDKFMKGKVN